MVRKLKATLAREAEAAKEAMDWTGRLRPATSLDGSQEEQSSVSPVTSPNQRPPSPALSLQSRPIP